MELGTFDLTNPNVQGQQKLPKMQPAPPPILESKTLSVSMAPKKDAKPVQSQNKLPVLPAQLPPNQTPKITQQIASKVLGSRSKSSSKFENKNPRIEKFRNVLEQAQEKLQTTGKKDKKPKITSKEQDEQTLGTVKNLYQKQVTESVNRLYNQYDEKPELIAFKLNHMEKKKNIQTEIEKKVQKIQKDKQEHDSIIYDIRQKQLKIQGLDSQLNDLGNVFANSDDILILESKRAEAEALQEILDQAHHETSILTYMFESRKKLLMFIQKQCKEAHEDLVKMTQNLGVHANSLSFRNKNIESLSKMISHYRTKGTTQGASMWGSLWKSDFDQNMQLKLSDELSLFQDKKMFEEVIGHEKRIEDEKLKELEEKQKQDLLKAKQDKDKANEKIRTDKKKVESLLNERKKMFEKLRKVTRVKDLDEIIDYKNDQEDGKSELNIIQTYIQKEIDANTKEIDELSKKLAVLQYQTGNEDDKNQIKIDDLERELMRQFDLLQDKEKQVKKVEKSIDEVAVAMSRIMYQLQGKGTKNKNTEITREKLVATASVVSLRLERMLTVLSKKKEFLNEESINSNPHYVKVPDFIGINQKTYAELESKDYIENDVFVYKEDDSLDQEENNYFEEERDQLKNPKDLTMERNKEKEKKSRTLSKKI